MYEIQRCVFSVPNDGNGNFNCQIAQYVRILINDSLDCTHNSNHKITTFSSKLFLIVVQRGTVSYISGI